MSDNKVSTISVQAFKNHQDQHPDVCLIDVREEDEWKAMRIPGAHLIPKDQLPSAIKSLVPDRTCPVYLHCRGGVRSFQAAEHLITLGYENVYSIDGGLMAWEACGYPIEC